jgi:hypothetical protein
LEIVISKSDFLSKFENKKNSTLCGKSFPLAAISKQVKIWKKINIVE